MFINLQKYIAVLTHFGISANQFLLCYLLYTDEREDGKYKTKDKPIANLYKYTQQSVGWTQDEIDSLVDKGLIKDYNEANRTKPDLLEVTEKFKTHVFIYPNAFQELWDLFPATMPSFNDPRGPKIKLKGCDKFAMEELYLKKVKGRAKHKRIMNALKWAMDNGELNFGIEKFIRASMWETLIELQDNNEDNIRENMHAAQ